jgi:hypothetical protein
VAIGDFRQPAHLLQEFHNVYSCCHALFPGLASAIRVPVAGKKGVWVAKPDRRLEEALPRIARWNLAPHVGAYPS